MKKNRFIAHYRAFFLGTILFSGILLSCKESDEDLVKPKTIMDVIFTNDQFSILREIIMSNKMGDALRTEGLTLFAPNNAAFQKSGMSASSVSPDSAISFLNNHILGKRYEFSNLPTGKLVNINKKFLEIKKIADSTLTINGAKIVSKNVNADNGIIQVVDSVLIHQ